MNIVGLIVGILFGALISAVIIWIVGKIGAGMHVSGFGSAFLAALVIAVIGNVLSWLLRTLNIDTASTGGIIGAIVYVIQAAIVLKISDKFVPGLRVDGWTGAVIAAISMTLIYWVIGRIVG